MTSNEQLFSTQTIEWFIIELLCQVGEGGQEHALQKSVVYIQYFSNVFIIIKDNIAKMIVN